MKRNDEQRRIKQARYNKEWRGRLTAQGLCCKCGKPADAGRPLCRSCSDKDRKQKKEDYRFYKARGICTQCRHEPAMINFTMCAACAEKLSERARERYQRQKNDPEWIKKQSDKRKERLQKRREAGLCLMCGKRKSAAGRLRCNECLREMRARKARSAGDRLKRTGYADYGLCWFCGEPVYENHRTCKKHYDALVERIGRLNEAFNNKYGSRGEWRKKFKAGYYRNAADGGADGQM